MKMRTYNEVIKELDVHGFKPYVNKSGEGGFYNYSGLRLESQFQEFFLFGQEYLDGSEFRSYKKKPARFIYNEIRSVNACARNDNPNYSVIEIFRGTFINTYDFFISRNTFFKKGSLMSYRAYTESDTGYFLFQFIMLYFFYHEVGHLIQFSANNISLLEYADANETQPDILTSHAKEFDADWFSATQLAHHTLKYINTHFADAENKSQITVSLAGLVLSGIYVYYIWRSQQWSRFYVEEESHPHPLVRLRYLVEFMLENLHENISNGISMDSVINETLQITDCLLSEHQATNLKVNKMFWEKMPEINSHIDKIKKHISNSNYFCISKMAKK